MAHRPARRVSKATRKANKKPLPSCQFPECAQLARGRKNGFCRKHCDLVCPQILPQESKPILPQESVLYKAQVRLPKCTAEALASAAIKAVKKPSRDQQRPVLRLHEITKSTQHANSVRAFLRRIIAEVEEKTGLDMSDVAVEPALQELRVVVSLSAQRLHLHRCMQRTCILL
jgi:hypothetical protein